MKAPYIDSQPVLKTFFFVHEIAQLVLSLKPARFDSALLVP